MAVNKVVYNTENGPETLIDLTGDTVTPETLAEGATAHDASGGLIIGTAPPVDLVQETGTSETSVMSQKAVTVALDIATPVRGVDYYTEEDKAEIVALAVLQIKEGGIVGYADENNNIILSGELADGEYTLKYENNGEYTEIGTLTVGEGEPIEAPDTTIVWDEGLKIDSASGAETTGNAVYSASNYIEIVDGYTYTINKITTRSEGIKVCYYSENKKEAFISTSADVIAQTTNQTSAVVPLISGAKYFRIRLYGTASLLQDGDFTLTATKN